MSKEAIKLALEALERVDESVVLGEGGHLVVLNTYAAETVSDAITTLRKALAEQSAQPLTEEENSKLFDLLIEEMLAHSYQGSHDYAEKVAIEIRRMYKAALREALAEQPAQQDIPDLIAGALGVSRGTAYDMMREALAEQPAQQEHVTDGSPCWCNPELDYKDPDTGAEVWIHKEPQ